MSTSGSVNFSQSKNQLILDAFQLIGIYGIGRTVSAEDMTFASNILNKMVKAWGTKGLHLWCKSEGVLFLTPYSEKYSLGSSSSDAYAATESDVIITKLNGSAIASTTALTVDNTTGMATSDKIGIVTSDKTIHWTTIATIPTSTTLTITLGLDSAADDNTLVYTFTSRINKPLRMLDCRRRTGYNSNSSTIVDIPMSIVSHSMYFNNSVKTSNGEPVQAYYDPELTNGNFYLWPRPTDGNTRVHFTYERIIEDLDDTSDDFDFPSEWLEALTYQLAVRLARPFGVASALTDMLPLASTMLEDLLSWDNEVTTISMEPDTGYEE